MIIDILSQNLFFLLKRYIHDEMYGVKLDSAGNYLLMGGSGDEYSYSETNSTTGAQSDVWVSYLVVLDPQVSIKFLNQKILKRSTMINS